MTHDESSSWLLFHNTNFWETWYNEDSWRSANNHLLNTFLFKQTISLFGQSDWVVRLPNVMAHLVYLGASIFIILQLTNKPILGLAGWILLNLNPYLLDFFSLARGYGLAMGFTMLTLAFFVLYIKRPTIGRAFGIFISIALSILSNFTELIFLAALWLTYGLFCLQYFKWNFKKILRWQLPPLLISVLVGLLIWQPILWLQSFGEFKWGVSELRHTFWALTTDSLMGEKYLSAYSVPVLFYATSLMTIIVLWNGFRTFFIKEETLLTKLYGLASFLFVSIIVVIMLQKQLLGTQYISNRKSLLFIPLWGWLLFCFLLNLKKPKLQRYLAGLILFTGLWHFSRCMNVKKVKEWEYDHQTLNMLNYLEKKLPLNKEINLGVHWVFHPTSMYYKKTKGLTFYKNLHYDKNILPSAGYDYYYVFKDDYKELLWEDYEVEKKFSEGLYLLRKKVIGDW